jgi:hypothetical protein
MTDQQMPSVCPRCDKPMTRLVCGANGYFSKRDKLAVASGEAILGGEWDRGQPAWVCLRCTPQWAEVHRLAWQDYEWQVAKEQAIEAGDFELAAHFRDRQYKEIREALQGLVVNLVGGKGPGGRRSRRLT